MVLPLSLLIRARVATRLGVSVHNSKNAQSLCRSLKPRQKVGSSAGVETLLPTLYFFSFRLVLDRGLLLRQERHKWVAVRQGGVYAPFSSAAVFS